ncbi:hypothetical protein BDW74DRAFT_181946 [Aspergillus multicolor]|uniref:uncharacterized protein n=1 Tax=Aspergillus multicolor TaxID=41759 RepID=UPI003CCDA6D1
MSRAMNFNVYEFWKKTTISMRKDDYVYMLDSCYQANTSYIAIFEDDIIAADGWLANSPKGLSTIEERARSSDSRQDWLYLRLFNTETFLSWSSSDDFWYRNMALAFFLTTAAALSLLLSARQASSKAHRSLDYLTIAVPCLFTVPAFTGLFFMIGKYNVMPLQGVVEMNKYGCCTQGLIFPPDHVPDLIRFSQEQESGQTDSLIEEYADQSALKRFAYAPPQLQPVGIRSSRDNLEINTRSTWAFWSEKNDLRRLKREHHRMIEGHQIP